jgi:hypothetical protein
LTNVPGIPASEAKMARQVFFSFHHARDVWRASQVRNSWVTQDRDAAGFWDAAEWEAVKKKDQATIEAWIDKQLKGTSVTVVLIGAKTSERRHVGYEIKQSHNEGKGMLGVYIQSMKDASGNTDVKGNNPFGTFHFVRNGAKVVLSTIYPTYDWVTDNGRANIGTWIEGAAKKAGR